MPVAYLEHSAPPAEAVPPESAHGPVVEQRDRERGVRPVCIALVADPSGTAGRRGAAPPTATQRSIVPAVDGRGRVIGRQDPDGVGRGGRWLSVGRGDEARSGIGHRRAGVVEVRFRAATGSPLSSTTTTAGSSTAASSAVI